MIGRRFHLASIPALGVSLALLGAAPALGADIEKKWRLGFSVGGYNATGDVPSNSANQLLLRNEEDLSAAALYVDPRNDSSAFGTLGLEAGVLATLTGQYAVTKTFVIEASVGYQKSDLGAAEVSAQFIGNQPDITEIPFVFDTFRVNVGEVTRVPVQLTALARFRPRARFNPYFGAGIGHAFNGFTASDDFNELSRNMDNVLAQFRQLTEQLFTAAQFEQPSGAPVDLTGATIDVGDSFEWHLVAGAEFNIRKKWAMVFDLRWVDASRSVSVGFNGTNELGSSVPAFEDFADSERARTPYGGFEVRGNSTCSEPSAPGCGIVDGGQLVTVPNSNAPIDTDCAQAPNLCSAVWFEHQEFDDPRLVAMEFEPNGNPDPGIYYAQGGTFSTDGFSAQIGFRVAF